MDASAPTTGRPGRPRLVLASIGLLLVVAVTGCTGGSQAPGPTAFWDALRLNGADEAEGWATFREMEAAADIVMVAEVVSFGLSRTIQGDAQEDLVGYGKAEFKVIETLRGKPPEGLVPVEFLLGGNPRDYAARAEQIGRAVPKGRFLVFLRHKGGSEAGLYRLVNSNGVWGEGQGSTIEAPVSDSEHGTPYQAELAHLASFDELIAYARAR
jgi:hypothetical protein